MRNILGYVGVLLEIFAAFLILPIIVATYYGEQLLPFFAAMMLALFAGIILDKKFPRVEISISEGIMLTAFSFIILMYFAAIPYFGVFGGSLWDILLNSFFESLSGLTTTGLSVMPTVEGIPKSVLFWRSETQWMGGMGIIVVFLSILGKLRTSSLSLYGAQGYTEKIEPTVIETSRRIINIYVTYSAWGIVLLMFAGIGFYDAICTAFTAISTGGFTVVDEFYSSPYARAVVCMLMLLGSINFFIHDKLFRRRFLEFLGNIEVRAILITITIASAAAFFLTGNMGLSVFEIVSALTATGYTLQPISTSTFSPMFLIILIILMFIGSSSGSTAGGIKQMRFVTAMKSIPWTIKKLSYPTSAEIPFKIAGNVIDDEHVRLTGTFITTYLIFMIIGAIAFIALGYNPVEAVFEVASAQGTVGLSIIDLSIAPAAAKIVLMCSMLIGRLEIFPLLILLENLLRRQ